MHVRESLWYSLYPLPHFMLIIHFSVASNPLYPLAEISNDILTFSSNGIILINYPKTMSIFATLSCNFPTSNFPVPHLTLFSSLFPLPVFLAESFSTALSHPFWRSVLVFSCFTSKISLGIISFIPISFFIDSISIIPQSLFPILESFLKCVINFWCSPNSRSQGLSKLERGAAKKAVSQTTHIKSGKDWGSDLTELSKIGYIRDILRTRTHLPRKPKVSD